ncbi:spore germination protein GerW family protein [Halorussus salinus]|uniref:spore germination protein GerW family protein n=1 Tax=Halorussus salinus TaxID=1364935 RepID=UPI001091E4FD|nr:spore germination protein GerW family protein [Halorussus salinus]
MSATQLDSLMEHLNGSANVRAVFGDPIERDDRTVVPVARVAFGFGGGFGESHGVESDDRDDEERGATPGERDEEAGADDRGEADGDDRTGVAESEGGGGGGGGVATPVGALEIGDDGTRFVRFGDRRRSLALLVAGCVVGWLAGRRAR